MQGLIQAYPDLKGVISPTTVGVAAAARYLSTSPQKGKIKLTGLGFPNQMRKYVKDGTVDEFQFKVRYGPVTIVGCTQTADGRLKLLAAEGESILGETFRIGNTNSRLRFGAEVG